MAPTGDPGSLDQRSTAAQFELVCTQFENAWKNGEQPRIEDYVSKVAGATRTTLLVQLLQLEWDYATIHHRAWQIDEYLSRFPKDDETVRRAFDEFRTSSTGRGWDDRSAVSTASPAPRISIEQYLSILDRLSIVGEKSAGAQLGNLAPSERPHDASALGRLLVERGVLTPFQAECIETGRADQLLLNQYVLLDRLGAGGMGEVYRARHRRMKRIVALKLLTPAMTRNDDAIRRFQREAEAAARLTHPNIVQAFDADEAGGVHYLAMEYVVGRDLSTVVREQGPLDVPVAVDYILQAAHGLAYAHEGGLIHRDIKPANLLLDQAGRVKILDLGLARLSDGEGELTASEQVMGTIDFMSPEQAADAKHADARSDIYSLGMTLWYLLIGRRAYDGDSVFARMSAHRDAPLPSLVGSRFDVPETLEPVFHKLVAKRAADRYQTMAEVIEALEPFVGKDATYGNSAGSSIGTGAKRSPISKPVPASVQVAVAPPKVLPQERTVNSASAEMGTDPKSEVRAAPLQTPALGRAADKSTKKRIAVGVAALAVICSFGLAIALRDRPGIEEAMHANGHGTAALVPSAPAIGGDVDRRAAEWVLRVGGLVHVEVAGQSREINLLADLPPEPFEVAIVGLQGRREVTDDDLIRFDGLAKLRRLVLGATPITDAGLAHLKTLPSLQTLYCDQLKLTDDGARQLARFTTLQTLSLGKTRFITAAAIADLRKALPNCEVLWDGSSTADEPQVAAPLIATAPFDAAQARAHQEAWAKYLGTTVETVNSVGQKMILIPPGEFLMGSSDEQVEAALKVAEEFRADRGTISRIEKAESPQHKVVITKPYLLSATEVTIGQFKKFSATGYVTEAEKDEAAATAAPPTVVAGKPSPKPTPTYLNPGFEVTDDSPAAVITWNDAAAYCKWLSDQEKTTYRLPTEAEWEYACRAGTTTQYSFGDDYNELPKYGWHNKNAGGRPRPVGTLLPNGFGLFDMHGNLIEWCRDNFDEQWYPISPSKDPTGPHGNLNRVIRGGFWLTNAVSGRSACRHYNRPSALSSYNGFRIVRTLDVPPATAVATASTPPVVVPPAVVKPAGPAPPLATPPLATAPFDAAQAQAHQAAWAKHLGTTVETVNSVGAKMILIPPGEFLMGSSDEQVEAALNIAEETKGDPAVKERVEKAERPQRRVVITKPFQMGATEVTVGQFKQFVEATQYVTEAEQYGFGNSGEKTLNDQVNESYRGKSWRAPGFTVTDDLPVAQVTWNDAAAYCRWLSDQEKTTYRLPTEAEWEYACRAGTATLYSFGDDVNLLDQYGWYNKNAGGKSHGVGTKPPNAFGLHDMHGNLWEWCQDFYGEKWNEQTSSDDPTGPASGSNRVLRGGHWNHNASYCRSASRYNSYPPSSRSNYYGFRVARVLDAPPASETPLTPAPPQPNPRQPTHVAPTD
jgi:formylglycine-generating enzyme required for sulfatase activity/serine/threonine protein kinase